MSERNNGIVASIYGLGYFGTGEPCPFLRDVLRQIDALIEGRDKEWDEFGLGVIQGLCVAAALHRKREGIELGYEDFYSWDDMKSIREWGCIRELRSQEDESDLERLYKIQEGLA